MSRHYNVTKTTAILKQDLSLLATNFYTPIKLVLVIKTEVRNRNSIWAALNLFY